MQKSSFHRRTRAHKLLSTRTLTYTETGDSGSTRVFKPRGRTMNGTGQLPADWAAARTVKGAEFEQPNTLVTNYHPWDVRWLIQLTSLFPEQSNLQPVCRCQEQMMLQVRIIVEQRRLNAFKICHTKQNASSPNWLCKTRPRTDQHQKWEILQQWH